MMILRPWRPRRRLAAMHRETAKAVIHGLTTFRATPRSRMAARGEPIAVRARGRRVAAVGDCGAGSQMARPRKQPPPGPVSAADVIAFIETVCFVPEGKLVGQPLRLQAWQKDILRAIYDNPHGTRRAIISLGRKNAKTTLAACLLLAHLCGPPARNRPNSELYSAAQSRDQAGDHLFARRQNGAAQPAPDAGRCASWKPPRRCACPRAWNALSGACRPRRRRPSVCRRA